MLTFKLATHADEQKIHDLVDRLLPSNFTKDMSTDAIDYLYDRLHQQDLASSSGNSLKYIAAIDETDKICGYAGFVQEGPDLYFIPKLYVLDGFRGQGVGHRLFETLKATIKSEHAATSCKIELYINSHNPAYNFYQSVGLKKVRDGGAQLEDFFLAQDVLGQEI